MIRIRFSFLFSYSIHQIALVFRVKLLVKHPPVRVIMFFIIFQLKSKDTMFQNRLLEGCPNQKICESGEAKLEDPKIVAGIQQRMLNVKHKVSSFDKTFLIQLYDECYFKCRFLSSPERVE